MDPCKYYLNVDTKYDPKNLTPLERAERYLRVADDTPLLAPPDDAPLFSATGYAKADRIIHELTKVFRYPQKMSQFYADKKLRVFRGGVIHGKPGTGKSSVADALRDECSRSNGKKLAYFDLDLSAVLDGNPSSNLEKAFDAAVRMRPSLMFIDEVDLLLDDTRARLDRVLLRIMNGLPKDVFVLVATNDLSSIPEAVMRTGRLELIFELELPSEDEKFDLLSRLADGCNDSIKSHLRTVAKQAKHFSLSDLHSLWTRATLLSCEHVNKSLASPDASTWSQSDKDKEATVSKVDLDLALKSVQASKSARSHSSEDED